MLKKSESLIVKSASLIAGEWVGADSGAVFAVHNPANGEKIADVPDMGREETARAIKAAAQAFTSWRAETASTRSDLLLAWYEAIIANKSELAFILTSEQGKPLKEAEGEIIYAASFIKWFAEEGRRLYGDLIPSHKQDAQIMVMKQPIGVCGSITPWNFPAAMITRKLAPALAAGCTEIVKPASETPLTALALAKLADDVGMPKGVINVITGRKASEICGEMMDNFSVRKISFTGSTEIGQLLVRQSADTMKKLTLELGGHAPFIVFEDADLDRAVQGAIISKYRNAGQTCVCTNRFYIQDKIYDEFAEKFTRATEKLKIGPGTDEGVEQGPLINKSAVEKVKAHIEDAVKKGGRILTGGKPSGHGECFFAPTIIADASEDMLITSEETFGPVAPLYRFHREEEAVAQANNSPFGLASYCYTKDLARAFRVGQSLEYGMVGINEGILSVDSAPFGGVKMSGFGREGSKYGIDEYCEMKYMLMGGLETSPS